MRAMRIHWKPSACSRPGRQHDPAAAPLHIGAIEEGIGLLRLREQNCVTFRSRSGWEKKFLAADRLKIAEVKF
jgi:hypothetical protein